MELKGVSLSTAGLAKEKRPLGILSNLHLIKYLA
jgi:hypothetical protein